MPPVSKSLTTDNGAIASQEAVLRIVIAVVVLLMLCAGVRAQTATEADTSANFYFLGCKAFAEARATNARLAGIGNFCAGVAHGLAHTAQYFSPPEWQSCAPATSDARQLLRVIVSYIEARPQRMHEDFRLLTLEAFHHAWPCKSGR